MWSVARLFVLLCQYILKLTSHMIHICDDGKL